jgi:hypothetical protein
MLAYGEKMGKVDKAKIGKKDEKLIDWDNIRHQKGIGTHYPRCVQSAAEGMCNSIGNYNLFNFLLYLSREH